MTGYRHADRRLPLLWESSAQPPGRWHGNGEGPAHYFADTPDGAWAEFLRHEEIVSEEDLATVDRALWTVRLPDTGYSSPRLPASTLRGGRGSYPDCQAESRRLRAAGAMALRAPSAALAGGGAAGWRVDDGLVRGPARAGTVAVLFGPRPELVGWCAAVGRPSADLLARVRYFDSSSP